MKKNEYKKLTHKIHVFVGIPKVQISSEKSVVFGSKTTFVPEISSCPVPDGVEWQTSVDGETFAKIDISKPKYFNSSCNPENPILEIPKVTFADKFYYRLLAWNKIGSTKSNIVHLNVTGGMQIIFNSLLVCIETLNLNVSKISVSFSLFLIHAH